jgi:hypothetical protein
MQSFRCSGAASVHERLDRRKQISIFAIPRDVDCPTKVQIHRPDRGGRRKGERGNAEPVAGRIDVTVFVVDYLV